MRASSLWLFLFACSIVTLGARDQKDDFIKHFYDEANVSDYVVAVDGLIDTGEAKIYATPDAEKQDTQTPQIKTRNGVFMLYTVAQIRDGVLVHFSVSRAPYLPTAFGRTIVGLFMERSGWPAPSHFEVSKNQVFHAMWLLPKDEFDRVRPALLEMRTKIRKSQNAKEAMLRGQLRTTDLNRESKDSEMDK